MNHTRPLGQLKNHYFHFDNVKKVDERLHPKVQIPLAGLKHVLKDHQVLNDIAPDFQNQKITNDGSVLPQKASANPHRTHNTHFTKKRNEEILISSIVIIAISSLLFYVTKR
jgi:hypothetical protein